MKFGNNGVKRIITCAALAVAAVLGTTAPASAAYAGDLVLCSYGDYASYVEFPARNSSSRVVPSGQCTTIWVGTSGQIETIVLIGITEYGEYFWVGNGRLNPNKGGVAHTYGTKNDHWTMTPQT